MRTHSNFSPLCLLLLFSRADALFGYGLLRCLFTSTDDVVYLGQIYLNKVLLGEYNSTVGKYVGFTEKAIEIAADLNKNRAFLKEEEKNLQKCKTYASLAFDLAKAASLEKLSVRLRSVEESGSRHPAMLICSVYNFYPKQITVSWLRNGEEVTSDVTSTEEMSNGNWLYQIHSYLEFTPKAGEKITCMVEHISLRKPKLYDWDPTLPESEKNKLAVGTAGLVLGLVFSGAGLIYYKKNTIGRTLVPPG